MAPIQTFVFIDFGTVFGDRSRVTEVGLLSVPRALYLDPNLEEPSEKLLLDFLPDGFNLDSYNAIKDFLNKQKTPVCLVAHNGKSFDFPILKRELNNLNVSLSDDVLCADSIYAYFDILEKPDKDDMQYHGSAVRKIFYKGAKKPSVSYKLGDIYERERETYPSVEPHPPGNDNIMNFRISRKWSKQFLAWTEQIQRDFKDVDPEDYEKIKK